MGYLIPLYTSIIIDPFKCFKYHVFLSRVKWHHDSWPAGRVWGRWFEMCVGEGGLRPSHGVWGNREKAFISGEQGNRSQILRGPGKRRYYLRTQEKQILDFRESGKQATSQFISWEHAMCSLIPPSRLPVRVSVVSG